MLYSSHGEVVYNFDETSRCPKFGYLASSGCISTRLYSNVLLGWDGSCEDSRMFSYFFSNNMVSNSIDGSVSIQANVSWEDGGVFFAMNDVEIASGSIELKEITLKNLVIGDPNWKSAFRFNIWFAIFNQIFFLIFKNRFNFYNIKFSLIK